MNDSSLLLISLTSCRRKGHHLPLSRSRNQKKRTEGHHARDSAETWATTLARQELGDSLQIIVEDLGIPYETAKAYSKLARLSLKKKG